VWTPPGVDPDAPGGLPDWDGMDPKSKEYACVVHGVCESNTTAGGVAAEVGWDPSTVPEPWTPPPVDEQAVS